jgi:hypothetical protein
VNSPVPPDPPTREQLQGSLRALHEELARTARVDASSHQLLQQLLHDMQRLLHDNEKSADAGEHAARPTQRLQDLAVLFEAEHPRLAGSLRQFVELCSRAGL